MEPQNDEQKQPSPETFALIEDYLYKKKCTSLYFGHVPINQKYFECTRCNKKKTLKICQYCYEKCHKNCRKKNKYINMDNPDKQSESESAVSNISKSESSSESEKFEIFACECGLSQKHKPPIRQKINVCPCTLMELDKNLEITGFFCKKHQIRICAICYAQCHRHCEVITEKRKLESKCNCQTEHHTGYGEIILRFNFSEFQRFAKIPIWPIQILNNVFEIKQDFSKMSELFIETLNNPLDKIDDYFYFPLLESFSAIFNEKFQTFYYNENLLQMFDFDKIIKFFNVLKTTSKKITLIKLRVLYVIYYLHIKKDFQGHKNYTSNDFLSTGILQRLKYKKMILMSSTMNDFILKKYFKKDFIIKKLTLEILLNLLNDGMKYLDILENQDEFEMGLKVLQFILKHFLLSIEQIKTILITINLLFNSCYDCIIKNNLNIYFLYPLIEMFLEIILEITISYNDNEIEQYIFDNKKIGFIHKNNEIGNIIFQILIKNCDILKMHYDILMNRDIFQNQKHNISIVAKKAQHELRMGKEKKIFLDVKSKRDEKLPLNNGLLYEKYVIIFEQILNLYCNEENIYKKQISLISKEDIEDFIKENKQIKSESFGNFYYIKKKPNLLKEFKENIENCLFNLFNKYYDKTNLQLDKKIIELIDNLIQGTNDIFRNLSIKIKKKSNNNVNNAKNLITKIYDDLKNEFNFLSEDSFIYDEEKKNNFYDSLCLYSIDETLNKLFLFFTKRKLPLLLTMDLFQKILNIFKLYFLSKRGIEYFVSGKNISRLNKIFRRFQCIKENKNFDVENKNNDINIQYIEVLLQFLNLMGKCLKFYNIKIFYNKSLNKIKDNIFEHLNVLNKIKDAKYLVNKKTNYYLIFKFFRIYEPCFEIEEFQNIIKNKLLKLFDASNLNNDKNNLSDFLAQRNITFPKKEKTDINIKLYFSFIKLIIKNSLYVFKKSKEEELYSKLILMFPLEKYQSIFENDPKNVLYIKERGLLLSFLNVLYLMEHLDKSYFNKKDLFLTNEEYKILLYNNILQIEGLEQIMVKKDKNISKAKLNELKIKYLKIEDFEVLLDIYISELNSLPKQCDYEDETFIKKYLNEILFGIQNIADFFLMNNNIYNKIVIKFYLLAKKFFEKSILIKSLLKDIDNNNQILGEYEKRQNNEKLLILENIETNIYDINLIYSLIMNEIKIIYDGDNKLNQYLKNYETYRKKNFLENSLIEKGNYNFFYNLENAKETKNTKTNNYEKTISNIFNNYSEQYIDVYDTNFYNILINISDNNIIYDYKSKLIKYFLYMYISNESVYLNKLFPIFLIINKLLYYDNIEMKQKLMLLHDNKYFFTMFNTKFHELFIIFLINLKYSNTNPVFININNLLLEYINFLQLLSDDFDYHDNIFSISKEATAYLSLIDEIEKEQKNGANGAGSEAKPKKTKRRGGLNKGKVDKNEILKNLDYFLICKDNIFNLVLFNLKNCIKFVKIDVIDISMETPFDKLIVVINDIFIFLNKYKYTSKENCKTLIDNISTLLKDESINSYTDEYYQIINKTGILKNILLTDTNEKDNSKITTDFLLRNTIICFIKIKFIDFIIELIYLNEYPKIFEILQELNINSFTLFKMILFYFKNNILSNIKIKNEKIYNQLIKIQKDTDFVEILLKIYKEGDILNSIIEFHLITKLFILTKIYQIIFDDKALQRYFIKLRNAAYEQKISLDKETDITIESYFAKRIFLFMESIILEVEIKINNQNKNKDNQLIKNEDIRDVSKKLITKIFNNKNIFANDDEIIINDINNNYRLFFIRPYITFYLSDESQKNFEKNENNFNKNCRVAENYRNLIEFSDYALVEMEINLHIIGNSSFKKFLSKIPFYILNYINFAIILVQNIILINNFYKKPIDTDYNKNDKNAATSKNFINIIISCIQVFFGLLVFIIFFWFKYLLQYQTLIMKNYNNFLILNKNKQENNEIENNIKEYFKNKKNSAFSFLNAINKNISICKILYIGLFEAIFFNKEINTILFTMIFNIVYILLGINILLVIPVIFLVFVNETLINIFRQIKAHMKYFLSTIIFILIINYLYSWITFYSIDYFYDFNNVITYNKTLDLYSTTSESFCISPLQCLLFIFEQGNKLNEGIGGMLNAVSFKQSYGIFIVRFFYDVIFFLFIRFLLINVLFALMIGIFIKMKNEEAVKENEDVCFICQGNKSICVKENRHNLWNYIYFLVHLFIGNNREFNDIENYVWKEIQDKNVNWFPIKE